MADSFELHRFVEAQEPVYESVCAELKAGRKRGHWMWFIFPQMKGLGSSPTSILFAIDSMAEARAYLEHPVLGPRLRECTGLVNAVAGRTAREIFGTPDDLKFRSSMTLFSQAANDSEAFNAALQKYFAGQPDPMTISRLHSS